MKNEAAERLHRHIDKVVAIRQRPVWHDEFDMALEEERRATVTRIRATVKEAYPREIGRALEAILADEARR